MSLTTRILPAAEWPRLMGTEAEMVWPGLDPAKCSVLVVERAQEIVGCWLLQPVLHAECLWIAPQARGKGAVAKRLWSFMQRTARQMGHVVVATSAISEDVIRLLAHVGAVPLPGQSFVMRLGGK